MSNECPPQLCHAPAGESQRRPSWSLPSGMLQLFRPMHNNPSVQTPESNGLGEIGRYSGIAKDNEVRHMQPSQEDVKIGNESKRLLKGDDLLVTHSLHPYGPRCHVIIPATGPAVTSGSQQPVIDRIDAQWTVLLRVAVTVGRGQEPPIQIVEADVGKGRSVRITGLQSITVKLYSKFCVDCTASSSHSPGSKICRYGMEGSGTNSRSVGGGVTVKCESHQVVQH
ncbi:hypothetical protein K488DRAFT_75033 [Vararia minispora EC-137]|uniref:Uncharacterized protein n=1 Tax=Vararia minispora EC-137 TaxID=1314806 RepID=A0ACB8Q592_9AGAM|nr:hypothetical protein K488DRAFT_75033 [Vararia minispora EC-137]